MDLSVTWNEKREIIVVMRYEDKMVFILRWLDCLHSSDSISYTIDD